MEVEYIYQSNKQAGIKRKEGHSALSESKNSARKVGKIKEIMVGTSVTYEQQ
jgi:hypothetical protein